MTRDTKIGLGILIASVGAIWWFNFSPPALRCFERGGTSFDIDGSCLKIEVQRR